ncbi:MAG: hypothetical protein C0407_05255 [Desulfobacca sp.]|nr:hypothetical protein [Desulfobacca sp.]
MEDSWEVIERFRKLIFEMGLPRNDYALFGVKCPYCGKSDRINRLESPEELTDCPEEYRLFWDKFGFRGDPVICTFCRQVLSIDNTSHQAMPPLETEGKGKDYP